MAKSNDELLDIGTKVALALGAYVLVVQPLLKTFGVDPASTAEVNAVDTASPQNNPFSMQYLGGSTVTQGLTAQDFITAKSEVDSGMDYNTMTKGGLYNIVQWGEAIYNAFGLPYSLVNQANFPAVVAVFSQFQNTADVSDVDAFLQANYQVSLWNGLKDGHKWAMVFPFSNGLNDTQLAQLVGIVKALYQPSDENNSDIQ